ncbi:MAG: hypothetical protein V1792_15525 [Pseudomonadota bacterium]
MTRVPSFFLTFLVLGLYLPPCAITGDDVAPLQASGGTLSAKSPHQTIRMDTEEVTVRLNRRGYTVDAVFQMVNSGETSTEWVGFPKGDELPETGGRPGFGSSTLPDFSLFRAWVDGKEIKFSKEGDRWLAGQVTFPGHATTTIRIVYEADYYRGDHLTYITGTGSHWKESIRKAAFTVDGSAIGGSKPFWAGLSDRPKIHRLISEKAVRIEVEDYEPSLKAVLSVGVGRP